MLASDSVPSDTSIDPDDNPSSTIDTLISLHVPVVWWEKVPCKISLNQMKDYNGFILQLQEREDVETWISPLFNAGFLRWRWKVNLVFRWPGERQNFLGIFSLNGRWSNTAPVDQESQRDYKQRLTCMQQVVWRVGLSFFGGSLGASIAHKRNSSLRIIWSTDPFSIANGAIYRGFRGERVP